VTYECGNERSVYSGAPDRCPGCGAEVVTGGDKDDQ
jgi:ribosomal protein S27E